MNKLLPVLTAVILAVFSSFATAQEVLTFARATDQVVINCQAPSPQLVRAASTRCVDIRLALVKIGFAPSTKPIDWKQVATAQDMVACDVLMMQTTAGGLVSPVHCKSGNARMANTLKAQLDDAIPN